jgi:putative addiction module CopG family antidote
MANTLSISLTEEQKEWLDSRRETGGFASASDVVRDLIRSRQEQEQAQLLERFQRLDRDGSDQPEPVEAVLKLVKQVKKDRQVSQPISK